MSLDTIVMSVLDFYTHSSISWSEFYISYSRLILDYVHISLKTAFNIMLVLTVLVSLFYVSVMLFSLISRKKPEQRIMGTEKWPFVTIHIPTYNELAAINCAKRCLAQDYPKDRYEILIGDDSSDKAVSEELDRFASEHKDMIRVTRRGTNSGFKPGNLNHMLKYTHGEFIIIFDSDFLPEENFMKRIIKPFLNDGKLAGVQARWRISNYRQNMTTVLGSSLQVVLHSFALPLMRRKLDMAFLCGSAEAVRKKSLVEVGGWKSGSLTEDIECSLRFIKKGYKISYLEDLECDCETPFTVKDFCKQQMRWAYGVITAFKEHFFTFFFTKKTNAKQKLGGLIVLSGYTFSLTLLSLFVLGMLSFFTDRPAPINWAIFFSETGRNILLTCGVMMVTMLALVKKRHARYLGHLLLATFSIGLLVTFYVNLGIFKALLGRPMHWFMISKIGNSSSQGGD